MSKHRGPPAMIRGAEWKPTIDDPEIQEYLRNCAGEEGLQLFRFILENEPITGEEIVEQQPDQKPSNVRKLLYALMMDHALEYDKDTDSKGWETFNWATDLPELRLIHLRRWQAEAKDLEKQIRVAEDHEWYACKNDHDRVMFEEAMDMDFHCPSCETPMDVVDHSDHINALKERLSEFAPALQA